MAMERNINVDDRCTGCNLCVSLCPVDAINLRTTDEGFWYPFVDSKKCVDCGQCLRKCPVYGGQNKERFSEPISYAGWNQDVGETLRSSSGGIFSLLAKAVLGQGGVIYGVAYNKSFDVEHIRIDSVEELDKLRRSKYVQSFISKELFDSLKKDINSGKAVLFSGTPCQVAAVNQVYSQCNNLITVDVVCHGVPSPKAWRSYLEESVSKNGSIKSVNMRKKAEGWGKSFFQTEFFDNSTEECWFNDNIWGLSFVKNLFLRRACYHCEFKDKVRCSDISLGNFWEAARGVHKELDNHDRGTSVILVNSEKGKKVFDSLISDTQCFIKNIPYHWIPKNTYAVEKSSEFNPNRDQAYALLDKVPFSEAVKNVVKESSHKKIERKVKSVVKRVVYSKPNIAKANGSVCSRFNGESANVGILNIQEVDNYGAVLLCYALQSTIENLGYKAEVIDFRPILPNESLSYIELLIKKVREDGVLGASKAVVRKLSGQHRTGVNISSDLKKMRFEEFRKKYLNRTPIYRGHGTVDSPIFDTYVVGSDVVWKPARVRSDEAYTYFLDFTDGLICNRIAYAASIGTDDSDTLSDIASLIQKHIMKFDYVSVREKTTVPFIKELYGGDVTWCIDPTLLLSQDDYDSCFALESDIDQGSEYIYLYLFDGNEAAYKMANRYSKAMGIPVICQCDNPEKINNLKEFSSDDGPIEFIQRVKNARFVITDSFHGTVFSIIYKKNFVTLSRGNISIRMKDLLNRLGLLGRYVENPETVDVELTSIDYSSVKLIIDAWREESMNYLKEALASKSIGGEGKNSNV